jgi:hypothetical protein
MLVAMAAELLLYLADRRSMSGATPEARTAVMILVEASWQDQLGALRSEPARMENRSAHGACIRIKARVSVGAQVYIQSHREQFSGIAKYCRVDGKEFLVGIYKDAVNRPIPKKPAPASVPAREAARQSEAVAEKPAEAGLKTSATFKNAEPKRLEIAHTESGNVDWSAARRPERKRESVSHRLTGGRGSTGGRGFREHSARIEEPIAACLLVQDARDRESPVGEPPPIPLPTTPPTPPPIAANEAKAVEQVQTPRDSEKKPAKKGRGIMKLKWFAGNEEEIFGTNGASDAPGEPVQRAAEAAPRLERAVAKAAPAAESASGFQSELLPVEDIYRAAGITSPRRGYSISKVVEMLGSEHMRGASRELRRAAVLMALDAAGVTVDEVLQDAKVRQEAIDAYAAEQRKHAEAQWTRKAEENVQIQAELEVVKAHYGERIRRNLDGVAREKATFGSWLKAKEQETQGMAEAVEQVLKAPGLAEPSVEPLVPVTLPRVTGKPV